MPRNCHDRGIQEGGSGTVDIAVIGAGVAGCVTALVAARAGRQVALVDGGMPRRPELGETLPPEVRPVLQELGLWQAFQALPNRPCWAHWSAWGSDELRVWDQLRNPYGSAWQVSRHALEAMLRAAAVEAGAQLLTGTSRVAPTGPCRVLVRTREGTRALAPVFVVDATGRRAAIARALGAHRVRHDRLVAAVRSGGEPAPGAAMVEAVPEGWWYSAPTAARLVVILLSDADLMASSGVGRPAGWSARLAVATHTGARAGAVASWTAPRVVSASTSLLEPLVGPGWVAVGDSAATYDPLSGHGILHSLTGGRQAAIAVDAALRNDASALAAYGVAERERFDEHLRQRRAHYGIERRWRAAPFWCRRVDDRKPAPGRSTPHPSSALAPG
jgi:flavin-dependent dehydrogenase